MQKEPCKQAYHAQKRPSDVGVLQPDETSKGKDRGKVVTCRMRAGGFRGFTRSKLRLQRHWRCYKIVPPTRT